MICANTVVRRKMGDSDMADVDVDAGPVSAAAVTSIEAAALGAARLAGGEGERALSEIASPTAGEAQGAVQPGEVAEGGTDRKRFRSPSLTVGCVAVQLLLKNTTHAVHGQCLLRPLRACSGAMRCVQALLQCRTPGDQPLQGWILLGAWRRREDDEGAAHCRCAAQEGRSWLCHRVHLASPCNM